MFLITVSIVGISQVASSAESTDPTGTSQNNCGESGQNCNVQKEQCCRDQCIPVNCICILEPLPGGVKTICPNDTQPLEPFFLYVNKGLWEWAFGVGIAIAVLQGVVAGFQITTGGQAKMEAGKERFMWAVLGLLMLLFAGAILSFINPEGFEQGYQGVHSLSQWI